MLLGHRCYSAKLWHLKLVPLRPMQNEDYLLLACSEGYSWGERHTLPLIFASCLVSSGRPSFLFIVLRPYLVDMPCVQGGCVGVGDRSYLCGSQIWRPLRCLVNGYSLNEWILWMEKKESGKSHYLFTLDGSRFASLVCFHMCSKKNTGQDQLFSTQGLWTPIGPVKKGTGFRGQSAVFQNA